MTEPRAGDGPGRELRRIVRVNEEIKSVVATAFKINLMAMNAIFLAKRAGPSALGFGVLSNELRKFAADLQQQMATLRDATYGGVSTVTQTLKRSRIDGLLQRTESLLDASAAPGWGRLPGRRDSDTGDMNEVDMQLGRLIQDTTRLVELGSVLARSAKIEAAYGGAFSAPLMQVSSDFENTIGNIQRSLASLEKDEAEGNIA